MRVIAVNCLTSFELIIVLWLVKQKGLSRSIAVVVTTAVWSLGGVLCFDSILAGSADFADHVAGLVFGAVFGFCASFFGARLLTARRDSGAN